MFQFNPNNAKEMKKRKLSVNENYDNEKNQYKSIEISVKNTLNNFCNDFTIKSQTTKLEDI